MFLHVVGHNERFRVVDLTFRRSADTISRFFQKVLYAVGELRNELIVPPATNVHPRILETISRFFQKVFLLVATTVCDAQNVMAW